MTRTSAESERPTEATPTSHPPLDRSRFVPGAVLDKRYRIVGLLGRGGMGEVYRADDMKLGQPVALKFLPEGLERDENRLNRFLNEVRTARQVTHPNVCRVFDIAEVDVQHYLSMEYVDGEDLSSLLRRIGRLPRDKAMQIARQLCAGVHAAHEQGILHRDLKPANVMIDGRGQVKITDFGLASLEEKIKEGEIRSGTPAYMAPEQLAGKEVTVKSDLYALGLVLYELFTGKAAFETSSFTEMVRLHSDVTPSSPSSHVEGFDPEVERIILSCLEKEPGDRPTSALAVSVALPGGDPLAAALAAGETPSPEMVAAAGATDAMHPGLALGLALLAVIGCAGAMHVLGLHTITSVMTLEKPPTALRADAREVVRELGYTEPLHTDPVDSAVGFERRLEMIDWIAENDSSPDRWDILADPRLGVLSFWYRQRPSPLAPLTGGLDIYTPSVGIGNPPADVPGEIVVGLDLGGRLVSFLARPKRISNDATGEEGPDWSLPFALAELEMAGFEPVKPRYDALVSADERAAWVGSLPGVEQGEVRIEAAATNGRIVLFTILGEAEARRLAGEPKPSSGSDWLFLVGDAMFVIILIFAVILARRNWRMGRADRRGAARLAMLVFAAQSLALVLASHRFWSRDVINVWAPIAATGALSAVMVWICYVALEPHARRVWPSILTSWSRLVSGARVRVCEPQVGSAVLAGLVGACVLLLSHSVLDGLAPFLTDTTLPPRVGFFRTSALGQRFALSAVLDLIAFTVVVTMGGAFSLVLGRSLLRVRFGGMLLFGGLGFVFELGNLIVFFGPASTPAMTAVVAALGIFVMAIFVALLVRFGPIAYAVSFFVRILCLTSATASWTTWHGQPGLIALIVVALLAVYGFWAAAAGRPLLGDGVAQSGAKA